MKFIFPKNYSFQNKLFGVFDYPTIFLNVIWALIVLGLAQLIFSNISNKIVFFVILFFPVFLFSMVGVNGENIIYFFTYLIRFLLKPKVLLYEKNKIIDKSPLHKKALTSYHKNYKTFQKY